MSEPLLPVPTPEDNSHWDTMPARCPQCGGIIDDRVRGDGKAWCQFHGLVTPIYGEKR